MLKEIDFTYCPNCAGAFEKKDVNLLVCPKCNLHFYINPKPTSCVIIKRKDGKILFVVRKFDPKKGMLDLPGGFININETLEEGTVRELKEELGITVNEKDLSYIGSSVDEYEHGNIDARTINAMYSFDLPSDMNLTPGDDVQDCFFVFPHDIEYEKLAFQGMKDFLKKYYS